MYVKIGIVIYKVVSHKRAKVAKSAKGGSYILAEIKKQSSLIYLANFA
jgi:hypothetical protein